MNGGLDGGMGSRDGATRWTSGRKGRELVAPGPKKQVAAVLAYLLAAQGLSV